MPGILRRRHGKAFRYIADRGVPAPDRAMLRHIRALAIPPAWVDVWICPHRDGHILATGRDARGRKQYRYHPRWREYRDGTKFSRMASFGRALPRLRRRVSRDLALPGLPREKVLATIVRLLERTLFRVGNEEYARANGAYGLTTLRDRHIQVHRGRLRFSFRGKSGSRHDLELDDPRVVSIVRRCRDLPGQELFQYVDPEGQVRAVGSADVNDYLRSAMGEDFTAKDFRTWSATALAIGELAHAAGEASGQAPRKQAVVAAIDQVARRLGNTRSVCRKCYVHPGVVDAYLGGALAEGTDPGLRRDRRGFPREAAVLALLRRIDAARGAAPLARARAAA